MSMNDGMLQNALVDQLRELEDVPVDGPGAGLAQDEQRTGQPLLIIVRGNLSLEPNNARERQTLKIKNTRISSRERPRKLTHIPT